jgi:hypothetical protein
MQVKTIDIGVDYLTLTTKEPTRYAEWLSVFEAVAAQEQARGHKWADARILGYTGSLCGHVFVGKRDDGAMARLSSSAAEIYGPLFSPDACHCSRIDIQATCELADPRPDFLEKAYEHAKIQKVKNGRPPVYTHLKTSEGGSTIYVGSRSSMRYGRIYDKGAESGTLIPGKCFRWELEIKDALADQAVALLTNGAQPERTIYSLLGDFFSSRFLPVGWIVPSMEEKLHVPRIAQDDAGAVRWLAGPVSSTFARIVNTCGIEPALRAIFNKCLQENSDTDIIASMAQMYAEHSPNYGQF